MPTYQSLDVFQKSLCSRALDESSLSIERVNDRGYFPFLPEEHASIEYLSRADSGNSLSE